jgi:hypothetical protein
MAKFWNHVDISQKKIYYIEDVDEIYNAREYSARKSYEASETNQLIINFKKPITHRGNPDWKYKIEAIERFAFELSELIIDDEVYVFAAIPTSICKTDPQYDDRLDKTLIELRKIANNVFIEEPISIRKTIIPSHHDGSRDPNVLYENMIWNGFKVRTERVILVDEVITTGSHFLACKRIILNHCPDMRVIGVFWARTIWNDVAH